MISLRHHVLTIVAVFLALAAGIVLGGRLADRGVAIVTVPGADEQVVAALSGQVEAAGGTVTARYDLAADLVDPAQKSLVDTLGSQLLTQQAEGVVAPEASTYDRIGQLIGFAVASKVAEGEDLTRRSRAVVDAVSGAGLMKKPDEVSRRAPLVLLVLGTDADNEGSDAILAGLAEGLAAQATGVVVAGTLADGASGQLARLRTDPAAASIASLDGVDSVAGQVATIMLLQRSLTTPGGSFGASGADGAAPLG